MPRFGRPLLVAGVALFASVPPAPAQDLPPPTPSDLARGLRENGMADLALRYLEDVATDKPPKGVAEVLPLERAKCRLELANLETDEVERAALVDQAKEDFKRFLAANAKHPRGPEATVALARLLTLEGKAALQAAKRLTDEAGRKAGAAKARAVLEAAAKQYDTAGLERLADAPGLSPARKAELVRDSYQAVLDRGINQYTLADAYLDAKGKEIDAKVKALNEALKAFDGLWQKDPQHPLGWVARAWVGETYQALGEPRKVDAAFKELTADARRAPAAVAPAAAAGLRMARYFQLREQFVRQQNDTPGRVAVRDACRGWLRDYPSARPTAEEHAVRYYLGTVLLKEGAKAENMLTEPVNRAEPKGAVRAVGLKPTAKASAEPLLREADAEFRKILATDNEYTDRAVRQRAQALRWLIGDVDRPAAEFPSFDQCYLAALVLTDRLRDAPPADRPATAAKVIALLERALTLPVPKESARDVVPAKVALAQTYNAANQPRKAGETAERVARDPANARNPSLVARTGLIALYGYQTAGQTAPADTQAADRERMIALCEHVERVAPADPNTDEVRLQHGVLLSQAGRGLDMFEALARIPARYPKLALARLYQGVAAYDLIRPRGATEAARKDDLPDARKADVYARAVAALTAVPVPPEAVKADESTPFVRMRLQLAQLHLAHGKAGYPLAEKAAGEIPGLLARFPDIPGDQKQALALRAESLRAKAVYGQAWPLYAEGKFAEAADRFAPLLAEVIKAGPAVKPGQEGELADAARQLDADRTRLVLVPTLNARIREGAVEKTGELLAQLQKFGGDVATTARVVQQGIAGVRPTVDALRREGKADEAAKLVAAVTGMVDQLAAGKDLPAEVRINLGRAFKDLSEYGKAVDLFAQVPAPADPAFLPGDPKVTPPENEPADARQKREAAFEANKAAAAVYRLAQLELHRCYRLSGQFDKCDALLDEVLGKDRKGGWGQRFPDFRREALLLSEGKAAEAKTPKEATPHWNAAMQGWRGWANEYKVAIDGLKAKADDPEEKVNEVRRKKEALKPTWYDLTTEQYRCTVAAQLAVYKADPAKLAAGLGSQARGIIDFEKNNAPLPTATRAKLYQLLEAYPELKDAYTKAGGTESLKAPVIDP